MEVAASVATELALSGLSLLIKKLASNFGGDVTPPEMEHLNVFVGYEIEALIRDAKSHDLVKSAPLLEKLQAAALELEDLLDLYEYNQIQKQVSSSSSNPIKKLKLKFKKKLEPILLKSDLRSGVEKLLKFIEQVEKKHPFITSRTGTAQPQPNPITPTTSALLYPYFGRKNQCDTIIEFLLDESHADSSTWTNKVPVIAIIGMGGSGKSHTAQRICDDDRIKNHFDANMWVHVTRDFDVVGLTRKMVESANNDECPRITNLDVLQKKLKESLSNRNKFLLVLDDVWCEDMKEWDLLVGPLNEITQSGSKIIMTTRKENIAYNLHAKMFHLEELKDEDCWLILKHYAFDDNEEIIKDHQELKYVGNQIISKVKHSPLALKVVGSSLRNKRSANEWDKLLQQNDILKETMDLLLFSYQCLPLHLQRCFAYCSLFPKGYKFHFDVRSWEPRLISLWIAQGFIENTSEFTLEEVGQKYIEELLSYSFFEMKSEDCFIIHDLLHDLAEKVSKKQCHRIEHYDPLDVPTTCIHLSLCITENFVRIDQSTMLAISNILNSRNLRSLIILRHAGSTNIFKSKKDLFQNLTKLRALYVDLDQQTKVLSYPHVDKLKHLRYLHVPYDSKLPVSLAKLFQLQFFILTTNRVDAKEYLTVDTLPKGFDNLINLRTLQFYRIYYELDYLYYNSKMISIEKLTSLQNLKKFYVDGFNEMISLRNLLLGGSLSILNLENVKRKEEAEEAMLNKKKNLNELIFKWSNMARGIDTCEDVLEGLEPHRNLERLKINGYQGVKFPKWMVKENWLPRLQVLHLRSCTSLKIVSFLPSRLLELEVENCHELMQLPPLCDTLLILRLSDCPKLVPPSMFNKSPGLSDMSFLTNLVELYLSGLPNLQYLTSLSRTVTHLWIRDCPKLTNLENLQCCTSLKWLEIWKCPMLIREEPLLVEGVVEGDITNRLPQVESITTDEPLFVLEHVQQQAFGSIKHLTLRDCAALPNLEMLSSLIELTIEDCPDVESLPNLPVSLRELTIRIRRCPKLKEKYEEDGSLRNNISHIPHIHIGRIVCM